MQEEEIAFLLLSLLPNILMPEGDAPKPWFR
jgi:hypothetical protein